MPSAAEDAGCTHPTGRWWQDPDVLRQEVAVHGNLSAAARAHGSIPQTLSVWWRKHGFEKLPQGTPPIRRQPVSEPAATDGDAWLLDAVGKLGDAATVEQVADIADTSPRRVREAAARLAAAGFRVDLGETTVRLERAPTVTGTHTSLGPELFDGDVFRFGVTSDEHTSSVAETIDAWEAAYDVFAAEGITTVLSPGDVVDGLGIYKGQVSEVTNHTYEAQVDHAVAVHPQRPGIVTSRIAGNHDLEGEFGRVGADPVQALCNRRPDIEYLGRYSAWVDLPNGARIHILHPMGGASYATSYKPQKIVEGYQLGDKPNILLIGHWHRHGYFFTRGVHTLMCGTFQGPTTYSVRKAFGEPGLGFHIVTCRLADDGSVVRFQPEWFPVFNGRVIR